MSEKKNSWTRRTLATITGKNPITKFGEKIGAPIRSVLSGTVNSIKLDKNVMERMRKGGLSGTIMGSKNYNTAFSKIKNLIKSNDSSGANEYIKSQKEKINKQ